MDAETAWIITIACVIVYVLSLSVGRGTSGNAGFNEKDYRLVAGSEDGVRSGLRPAKWLLRGSGITMILAFLGLCVAGLRSELGTLGRTLFVALEVTALALNVASTVRLNRQLRRDLER
jgi:hypothetical protein